jgi:hypothetical protein
VFGRKRAQQLRHRQQFINELSESMHALRRAAGHLAHGTAEHLTPTYDRARHIAERGLESTRHSMAMSNWPAREMGVSTRALRRAKKETMKRRSRMRTLRGLLITGAVVGAASAAVARRRRQQAEWAEYEKMSGFDESRYTEGERSARQKVASGAASMADSLSARAGRIADSLHERSASLQEKAGREGESSIAGPGPVGTPTSAMGTGAVGRERLGDPALDFPDER